MPAEADAPGPAEGPGPPARGRARAADGPVEVAVDAAEELLPEGPGLSAGAGPFRLPAEERRDGPPGAPRPSRSVAAAVGVLAVWVALGVGHLTAGLISTASSPLLAVGDTVVRLSPGPLTEFATSTLGTDDKLVLLVGMLVVITGIGAAAGVASRERPTHGTGAVAALGGVGAAAVWFSPVYAELDLVAPATAMLTGIVTFRWLHGLARRTVVRRPEPDEGETGPAAAEGRAAAAGSAEPSATQDGRSAAPTAPPGGPAASSGRGGRPAPDRAGGTSRRAVLGGAFAAVGVGALASAGLGSLVARDVRASRTAVTAQLARATYAERAAPPPAGAAFPRLGTPTFLTSNRDFYRIDTALRIPTLAADDWRLRVHGMVARELDLGFADLVRRPLVERPITLTCVSNPVGGDLVSTATFIGVPLRDVLLEAGVDPAADQLFSRSTEGFTTGTPMSAVLEPDRGALLAVGMNGEALPAEHGFPVRMVVPGLYGYVSATKWLVDLEATTFANPARQGFWFRQGWARFGPIKTMSRIDAPRDGATVAAGPVTVAGVAWAQHTGIAAVEVRADGGPWARATLSDEVSVDTWRMWHVELPLAPGDHTVEARATDRSGSTQTERRVRQVPNGATGWPAVRFTVA